MRTHTAIDAIADDYTHALAAQIPSLATATGLPGYDHLLEIPNPEHYGALASLNRATLAKLNDAPVSDDIDEVTVAAMRERLGIENELLDAHEWAADLNVIASMAQLRDVFDLMPTDTRSDWETIAARAALVPAAMAGYVESLRVGMAEGLMPARRQVIAVLAQAEKLADADSSFFTTFVADARPDGAVPDAALAAELAHAAASGREGYATLAAFLRDELLPVAPVADACGRERYERFSRSFVGAKVDLDETYAWGIDDLARITAEMDALAVEIAGPGASVADAVAALNADPARQIHGTKALQEWMQATADGAIAALDGMYFDIPAPVRTIECRIAPTASGGIYYTGPSEDWSRPGRMWWAVPEGVEEFTTWFEKTTVHHEGVPGHHLQVGQAIANAAELNLWRRLVCWMSGHGEGWALYSERLMEEFGFLDDPGDRLGMLDGQRLRATRVVLDLGLHLGKPAFEKFGGATWSYDTCWALLKDNVQTQDDFLRFELDRYAGWPGQAPSYKIGQRLWEQTRAEAEQLARSRGQEFSLKDFHTRALNLGSVPMDVLRAQLTK